MNSEQCGPLIALGMPGVISENVPVPPAGQPLEFLIPQELPLKNSAKFSYHEYNEAIYRTLYSAVSDGGLYAH
jgi:hypothetical protein